MRNGGCAEYVVAPEVNALPMPAGLSFEEAAAVPLVFLTAWHMLVGRARVRVGEDVLVHAGALLRLLATLAPGIGYMELVGASGLAWSAAFLVYFAVYLPRLMRPRPDGKPG